MISKNTLKRCDFNYKFGMLSVWASIKGIKFIVFRYTCTVIEQNKLYQQGRTKPGKIVTNCDGRKNISKHQRDQARDLVIIDDEGQPIWAHVPEYDMLGEIWESLGGKWGGNFKGVSFDDIYHFEL